MKSLKKSLSPSMENYFNPTMLFLLTMLLLLIRDQINGILNGSF